VAGSHSIPGKDFAWCPSPFGERVIRLERSDSQSSAGRESHEFTYHQIYKDCVCRQRVPVRNGQQGCPARAMPPLRGIRIYFNFRDSIADKFHQSLWLAAYPTQGHRGTRPYYFLISIVICCCAEVLQQRVPTSASKSSNRGRVTRLTGFKPVLATGQRDQSFLVFSRTNVQGWPLRPCRCVADNMGLSASYRGG
jgi:hypothetical protein